MLNYVVPFKLLSAMNKPAGSKKCDYNCKYHNYSEYSNEDSIQSNIVYTPEKDDNTQTYNDLYAQSHHRPPFNKVNIERPADENDNSQCY